MVKDITKRSIIYFTIMSIPLIVGNILFYLKTKDFFSTASKEETQQISNFVSQTMTTMVSVVIIVLLCSFGVNVYFYLKRKNHSKKG